MRWSRYFVPTTKETPKDATAASHILMLRSGMMRQLAAGMYTMLPLGYRVMRKVAEIVREEMNHAGAIELHMPVLQPIDLWHETDRVAAMGDVLLRLAGPEGDWRDQTVLGPTHEEVITETARAFLKSYKQLPINLYQIQVKFRGEARPKSGLLRTREFLMKDAYSFHDTLESLDEGYQKMYDAYCRIFTRCGLPYSAVEAESGPIGGDASHEFMVLTDAGEDLVALTENNDYAANLERATSAAPAAGPSVELEALREVHTPGAGKVDDVTKVLGIPASKMIKTLIYDCVEVDEEHGGRVVKGWVVVLVRGDHEVNEHKLKKILPDAFADTVLEQFEMATPQSIENLTGAKVGFAGPQGLADKIFRFIIDRDVVEMRNAGSGANKTDYHVLGVNPGRDFPIDGPKAFVADVRNVVDGDLSPTGSGSPIRLRKAIEVGHVFKLGTKYSDAMEATFLTREGKPQTFIMGCYGIGVSRTLAAVIEAHHDDNGVIWPMSVAPFEVLVISLDPRDEQVTSIAEEIYTRLDDAGIDVLYDDRDERAGFKFKDADLVGVPLRLVVGKKGLEAGGIELSWRSRPGEKQIIKVEDAVEVAVNHVNDALAALQPDR